QVQESLNLEEGPVIRGCWFDLGERGKRLLVVIHHLVVDGVSWRILLEDLQSGCAALAAGRELSLPARTSSYREWAEALQIWGAEEANIEKEYWVEATERAKGWRLRKDFAEGENTVGSTEKVVVELNTQETRALLQELPGKQHVQVQEVLVTALVRSLGRG